jgi:hypothetical protein
MTVKKGNLPPLFDDDTAVVDGIHGSNSGNSVKER